jgi:hypothetical protein
MFVAKPITYEVDTNGCWNCTSHKPNSNGYPVKRYKGKIVHLHRYIYLTQIGHIPEGIVVRHKCDNSRCINPDHFELGTQADNIQDMFDRGRNNSGKNNPRVKLQERDVIDIINLFNNGMRYNEIAKRYPVGKSAIKSIIHGKNWRLFQEKHGVLISKQVIIDKCLRKEAWKGRLKQ